MDPREFSDLAAQLKRGDNTLLKAIYLENGVYCISTLLAQFKCSRQDAEDLYTDSVMNFREKIVQGKVVAVGNLRGYLFQTCRNMLFEYYRKEKRVRDVVVMLLDAADSEESTDGETPSEYQEKIYLAVETAIKSLPDKCQAMLKSFYFERMTMAEIATRFNMASANVAKVSKSRCFQKLVELVRQNEYTHADGRR